MSIRSFVAIAAAAFAATPAQAQDAQSLIAKNREARGGSAALESIKSIQIDGKMRFSGGMEVDYRETRGLDGQSPLLRVVLTLQGLDIVQAYDGASGWTVNPLQGRKDAETMSSDDARQFADGAWVGGVLIQSAKDGSKVTYLGREDFDGTSAYKLKVAQKDGDEFVYWLDPDTYLEIKVDETRRVRGTQQTTETELGDYEKVAGVYFPMSVESWPQGYPNSRSRVSVTSITPNATIDPASFKEPRSAPAVAKKGMK